ncbi:T9SS type A sorting domain-containing protein [Kaistella palustris]|uniref:T9SS type A sorting domain-containing protein n=1 Tax=Kaistella palustris TaxID=493376 RepID=UPI000401AEC8|nr:T9SS type A sorting domain-containing protein [Kaistella palustris]
MKKTFFFCFAALPLLSFSQVLNHQNGMNGAAERHLQFKVSDTPNDVMEIGNSTSQNNQFQPSIWIHKESSPGPVMVLAGHITSAVDIGTVPVINLVAGKGIFDNYAPYSSQFPWGEGGTTMPVLNRPVFAVSNAYVNYLSVAANGNFGIGTTTPLAKLHNMGTVRFQNLPLAPLRGTCRIVTNYSSGELFADCSNIAVKPAVNAAPIISALNTVKSIGTFETQENGKKTAFINSETLENSGLYKDIDYAKLIPYLLESIKELNIKIEDLEVQLNTRNEKLNGTEVKVYPNPVSDYFNLYFEKANNATVTVKIYDAPGNLVSTNSALPIQGKMTLNVSNLATGTYYYEVTEPGKTSVKTGKFIKQ